MNPTEREVFDSVVKGKRTGVGFHTEMMEKALLLNLPGVSKLHQFQATDEYFEYLTLVEQYINMYMESPEGKYKSPIVVDINPNDTLYNKLNLLFLAYRDYENGVIDSLNQAKINLGDNDTESIDNLIKDTQDEIKHVDDILKHIDKHMDDEEELIRFDKKLYAEYKFKTHKF